MKNANFILNLHLVRYLQTFEEIIKGKGKGKVHPRTGLQGPEMEWRYSSTFFFNFGARWVWVVNATPRPLYPRERPGTHCMRLTRPHRRSGRVRKFSTPTGIRSPYHPACSESLYRLSCPGALNQENVTTIIQQKICVISPHTMCHITINNVCHITIHNTD